MLDPETFRELVSGQSKGVRATFLRILLRLAECVYRVGVHWRNFRYDTKPNLIHRVDVPVVSVGNLTLGGTGKTPLVLWLAHWFRQHAIRVTLISRGYGAEAGAQNDEALELEQRLPDVPHLQNANRLEAARVAISEFECQLLLLDDAFQHRRLHRDLEVVVIDALEPFGFGHVFPRGMLREPLSSLKRAQIICLSRANLVSANQRQSLKDRIQEFNRKAVWVEIAHQPEQLINTAGEKWPVSSIARKRIAAFCGIGNPEAFHRTLLAANAEVVRFRAFPDHHRYDRSDVKSLQQWTTEAPQVDAVLCTHKDLVKISSSQLGDLPLRALTIGVEILEGQEAMESKLLEILERMTSN